MIESYWLRTLAFLLLITIIGFGVYTIAMWALSVVHIGATIFDLFGFVGSWPN